MEDIEKNPSREAADPLTGFPEIPVRPLFPDSASGAAPPFPGTSGAGSDPFPGAGHPYGNASNLPGVHRRSGRRLKRRGRRYRGLIGFLAGLSLALGLALGARIWERNDQRQNADHFLWNYRDEAAEHRETQREITMPTCPTGQGAVFPVHREHGQTQRAQEIYRTVNPSVVTVLVDLGNRTAAIGTGVIFSADGYFITNYHVVEGGAECVAMMDSGRRFPALYVAGDEEHDLAVLKIDGAADLPAAEFGDSDLLTVGDDVYAIGNPLGVEFRGTLTNGIISAINRNVEVDGRSMTLIQTNAALNSGNSGGPLINEYGQVIGINVVKMSSSRATVEGLGFAIPSASMDRLINDLLTYGEVKPEPTLGVTVSTIGTEVEEGVWGLEVLEVSPESSAQKAGIREGDVILTADGEEITGTQDLLRVRRRYYGGEQLPMTLWRDGERVDVTLELEVK